MAPKAERFNLAVAGSNIKDVLKGFPEKFQPRIESIGNKLIDLEKKIDAHYKAEAKRIEKETAKEKRAEEKAKKLQERIAKLQAQLEKLA